MRFFYMETFDMSDLRLATTATLVCEHLSSWGKQLSYYFANWASEASLAREASPAGAKRPPAATGRAVAIELHTTQAKKLHITQA